MSGRFQGSASPRPTTAHVLAAYRDELLACGFSLTDATDLVHVAARSVATLTVGSAFLARAEPPVPIARIENHEPDSPEEAAAVALLRGEEQP